MSAMSIQRPHGLKRGLPVAGHPEIVAVDVHCMRQLHLRGRAGHFAENLSRRHAKVPHGGIESADIAAVLLPDLHAAGVHNFDAVSLGGPQQPRNVGSQALRLPGRNLIHDVMIVPHQDVKALVDDRGVLQFFVDVPRRHGGDGRIKGGRVPQPGIEIPRGERAGNTARRARSSLRRPANRLGIASILGPHFPRGIHLGPGDVTVHVDAARHHNHACGIDHPHSTNGRILRSGHHATMLHPEIPDFAIDSVGRIINPAIYHTDQRHWFFSCNVERTS